MNLKNFFKKKILKQINLKTKSQNKTKWKRAKTRKPTDPSESDYWTDQVTNGPIGPCHPTNRANSKLRTPQTRIKTGWSTQACNLIGLDQTRYGETQKTRRTSSNTNYRKRDTESKNTQIQATPYIYNLNLFLIMIIKYLKQKWLIQNNLLVHWIAIQKYTHITSI